MHRFIYVCKYRCVYKCVYIYIFVYMKDNLENALESLLPAGNIARRTATPKAVQLQARNPCACHRSRLYRHPSELGSDGCSCQLDEINVGPFALLSRPGGLTIDAGALLCDEPANLLIFLLVKESWTPGAGPGRGRRGFRSDFVPKLKKTCSMITLGVSPPNLE